jgi:hypothetical protein
MTERQIQNGQYLLIMLSLWVENIRTLNFKLQLKDKYTTLVYSFQFPVSSLVFNTTEPASSNWTCARQDFNCLWPVNRKNNYGNQKNKCHDSVDAIGRIQNTWAESRLPTTEVSLIVCQGATMSVPQAISQNGNCFRSHETHRNWLATVSDWF